ncbi:MAG: hypothetical protein ACOYYS_28165 [Chloroflexota bacterium]
MWYNPIITVILQSPFHWLLSNQMMLVSYTGHKSGQTYRTPVSYVELDDKPDEHVLLVISKPRRMWWRSLRGGEANVLLRGKVRHAQTEVFTGDAAIPALKTYALRSPQVAKSLGVGLDADRKPLAEDIKKLSQGWLIVQFKLAV